MKVGNVYKLIFDVIEEWFKWTNFNEKIVILPHAPPKICNSSPAIAVIVRKEKLCVVEFPKFQKKLLFSCGNSGQHRKYSVNQCQCCVSANTNLAQQADIIKYSLHILCLNLMIYMADMLSH